MKSEELGKVLMENPGLEIKCSVDISNGEKDAFKRAFGEEFYTLNIEASEIMLCFNGDLNKDA